MQFDPNKKFTTFPIDVLVGVDAIKDLAKAKPSENKNELSIQIIESLLMVKFGDKMIPFGVDENNKAGLGIPSSLSRNTKSLVSVSEKHPAMATYLDEILHKFFETEQDTLDQRTIQERIDDKMIAIR